MAGLNGNTRDVARQFTGWSRLQISALTLRLRESQWFMALLGSLVGTGVGYLTVVHSSEIVAILPRNMWITTVSEARSVLLAFIGVEITALSIVMSLTMISVQNAANQYSNRLLRYYLRDMVQQTVFGIIAGSAAYFVTVAAILGIDATSGVASRPYLGLAVLFLVASGVALIVQVNHTLQIIRLEVVLIRTVAVTLAAVENVRDLYEGIVVRYHYPLPISGSAVEVTADRSGYAGHRDVRSLVESARNHRCLVRLDVEVGNYLVAGSHIGWVQPESMDGEVPESVLKLMSKSIGIDGWRNPKIDVGLGIRVLVDIAIKALSPAVNDPYTAVMCIDHLATIIAHLPARELGDRTLLDQHGNPRVQLKGNTFLDSLLLSTDQINRYGSKEPLVVQRLLELLRDVARVLKDDSNKADVLYVKDKILADVQRTLDDPVWLKKLQDISDEVEETIKNGPNPKMEWPVGL